MSPPPVSSHKLSADEATRIFTQEILPAEFPPHLSAPPPPQSPGFVPLAVLAVGQTGAGKTRLAPALVSAFRASASPSRWLVHLIADTYKTYHPSYTHLMLSTPALASAATGPDARRWLSMAASEAVRRRLDVLVESACRHPGDFSDLAALFRAAGYRVEVLVLAAPAALSRLGILTRFYEKLPEAQSRNLPVRLTPTGVHDDSYRGLLAAAAFLDESAAADQVLVVRRGNLVAYSEERGPDGRMAKGGRIAEAVRTERRRPLTKTEMKLALDDMQRLTTHDDAAEQIEQVRALLQPLITQEAANDEDEFPELQPLEFGSARTRKDKRANVLRLGYV